VLTNPTRPVNGLRFQVEGPIAFVTIENAAEHNRLTPDALVELSRIAGEAAADDSLHVIVIRGVGSDIFSCGILDPLIRASMQKPEVVNLVLEAMSAFDAIADLPQIVIGGLNGHARAGGVELALACDLRIAADHAKLSMPEARWGGFPGAGGPLRLARLVGRARALDLICTGREVGSEEMEKLGIVQQVVPSSHFDEALHELATNIAGSGPLATRGAKAIMKASEAPGFSSARDLSIELRRQLEWSAGVDEGIRAHRDGRNPRFTGR
jgi:enoyl-CoA hydratase/carnithine racemase